MFLTGVEDNFADEYPGSGEPQLDSDPASYAVVQFDGDVPRALEDVVLYCSEPDRLRLELTAAYRKRYYSLREHLKCNRTKLLSIQSMVSPWVCRIHRVIFTYEFCYKHSQLIIDNLKQLPRLLIII